MRTNLKLLRVKHELSQLQMAEKLGVGRTTYVAIEKGQRDGSMGFWQTVQNVFNIPDAEMWGLMKLEKDG